IQLEGPTMRGLLARGAPGLALDAACGTGRQSVVLHELGHRVVGVDANDAMLAKARAKLPGAELRLGELESLPVETGTIDLAVCSLALTHVRDLSRPVAELTRVLRPHGRLVISDVHPFWVVLGAQAFYGTGYVRNYVHWPSAYLAAFQAAELTVSSCQELLFGPAEVELAAGGLDLTSGVAAEALIGLPAI